MSVYKKIGVIVADIEEYKPFKTFALKNGGYETVIFSRDAFVVKIKDTDIYVSNCGTGKVNATALTSHLIDIGCEVILNYGLSGGIADAVIGQFSIPTKYFEHDFDLTCLGYKPCEKPLQNYIYETDDFLLLKLKEVFPDAICGPAACGDRFISDKSYADYLKVTFGAVTCDMETAAIASVCDMAKIPFASLRRVSDGADESVKLTYRNMNINSGNVLFDGFYGFLISLL